VHKRRTAAASALLILTASLTSIAVAAPAGATSAADLYVDNTSTACTDSGSGSAAAPFCTIQAAADVVAPGQTVLIGGFGNSYNEDVKVRTSGTAVAPITFAAAHTYFTDAEPDHAFTLSGVSNIVIRGLYGDSSNDTVLVSGSSDITVENSTLREDAPSPTSTIAGVHVTGSSSAVTVKQNWFMSFGGQYGVGIRVDGGATGTVVASNYLGYPGATGIEVAGATGTKIAGNTIGGVLGGTCAPSVTVTAASASTSLENNVFSGVSSPFFTCPAGSTPADLVVSADSAATTTAKYNVLSTDSGGTTPYLWAGTHYTTATAFQQATGQGAQDLVPDSLSLSVNSLPTSSPMIDSADANAPGELATDVYGNPRVDDAAVGNTGTGVGYYDRGAIEYQEYTSSSMTLGLGSAQYAIAQVNLKGVPWGSSTTETIDWGDGTAKDVFQVSVYDTSTDFTSWLGGSHTYATRGTYTVTDTLTDDAGTTTRTGTITTAGSTYQPVAPTRVLDTRSGIGTGGKTTAVPARGSVAFSVTSGVAGAPAASNITAVVLNVTVTAPKAAGFITAYPDGTAVPNSSNLNYSAGETVPNLVTVKVGADGKAALYNASSGAAHLVADVEGYYVASTSGGGYTPAGPTRLLDTRKGTGVGGSTTPVAKDGTVRLKVAGAGPVPASGVTAVVLNVTVTAPTAPGFIAVYPGGTALPNASNVNFSPGETVPNLVTVPLGADGTVSLSNRSGGTTHLVADVFGYYTVGGGHAFVPLNPVRVLDTRNGIGQQSAPHRVAANGDQIIYIEGGEIAIGTALVLNVTVVGPKANGFVTAYQEGTTVPATSNLNFSTGETVPNMVISKTRVVLHNSSPGPTDLVADAFGYFS
jgi:hypothetical protein